MAPVLVVLSLSLSLLVVAVLAVLAHLYFISAVPRLGSFANPTNETVLGQDNKGKTSEYFLFLLGVERILHVVPCSVSSAMIESPVVEGPLVLDGGGAVGVVVVVVVVVPVVGGFKLMMDTSALLDMSTSVSVGDNDRSNNVDGDDDDSMSIDFDISKEETGDDGTCIDVPLVLVLELVDDMLLLLSYSCW